MTTRLENILTMAAYYTINDDQRHPESNTEHLTHPKYRADIDGLRAVAVLSVVGFHAFPYWVNGGFIGVDVFFVISGFLISTIIFGSLERDSFSFIAFYIRRIKRIFPALILMLSAVLSFGWFALLADEYRQLGKHTAGGAGFISNFLFWNESGYFDNLAETKPLLHLWSLGIEEQFYIIWPFLLWLAWKLRSNLLIVTIAVAVVSFALNIEDVRSDVVAAFYSPQTRFWELMAGSILAHLTMHRQNMFTYLGDRFDKRIGRTESARPEISTARLLCNGASLSGAALITIGVLVITKDRHFPGWWALLPTFGALLIILAGAQAWLNRVVLSHRVMVWFGLISYPLYLWHWPLLSFAHILESGTPSCELVVAAVLLSIALAWLTYRLIEKPFRFNKRNEAKAITLLALMVIVGYAGYYCYERDGFGFRLKDRQEYAESFDNSWPDFRYGTRVGLKEKWRFQCNFADFEEYRTTGKASGIPLDGISKECFQRNGAYSNALFIWGDSHAQQLHFGLRNHLPANWQILQVASIGCAPDVDIKEPSATDQCTLSNWFALKTIEEARPDVVIVAQNLGQNIDKFNQIAERLKAVGVRKVIFTGPTPHWNSDFPKMIARKLWLFTPRRTFVGINTKVLSQNAILQEQFKATDSKSFANLIDFFCNQEGCLTYLGEDKRTGTITFDRGHLTPVASDYLAKYLLVDLIVGNTNALNSANPAP